MAWALIVYKTWILNVFVLCVVILLSFINLFVLARVSVRESVFSVTSWH